MSGCNESDLRPKPSTITLDVADDEDSLRLWFFWDDLSPESRKSIADLAEEDSRMSLRDEPSEP